VSGSFDRGRAFLVFEQALGVDVAARPQFVRDSCDGDAALTAEVEALLAVAAKDGDATGALLGAASGTAESLTGKEFGHFRLVELLGEGGMGVVYRAERTDGLQQSVAIKLMARELAGSGQERFQRETRVLARLEHPAIARSEERRVGKEC
jgi:serine/threonine-protein kinase